MSEWTTDTLKESVHRELEELRKDIDRRFAAQQKEVETAFNAAKEAVIKSEVGVEKRSDAVYVTITKLQDALAAVMPRAEAEQRFKSLSDKLTEITEKSNLTEGKSSGIAAGWGYLVGAVILATAIIGTILAFNN